MGKITRIAGPVGAAQLEDARLYDVVDFGDQRLIGEVIRLSAGIATVQVYEDTSGVRVGEPVRSTGMPLVAWLGPGLLGQTYDGLQRPLRVIADETGDFIQRGVQASPLSTDRLWAFTPCVKTGSLVGQGDVLGTVPETPFIQHRVMIPPGLSGEVVSIEQGDFTIEDVIAVIKDSTGKRHEIQLAQRWPVRRARPVLSRLDLDEPLITGTRILDAFFPVAKGGAAVVPGGFGTGKTVLEQSLARWADIDIVVYVGCGERGNEMADVLDEFPELIDPRTDLPLMSRTVLIANTSNMPVAAREASIYTGITIAEYYRDMGYGVLLLADSTSRWGEALREIGARLEEIPGEEGYPAYLAARLSEFYERSGRVICLGGPLEPGSNGTQPSRIGSITVAGAVSPPGGDFSEPITQSSMRVAGTFWALDYSLSRRRHFPAISWAQSYTLYNLKHWYAEEVAADWNDLVLEATVLLQRADELEELIQLVGPEALSEGERLVLMAARMIREDFLQQSAVDPVDRFCPLPKTYWMLKVIAEFYHASTAALEAGMPLADITSQPEVSEIARMKELPVDTAADEIQQLITRIQANWSTQRGGRRSAAHHPAT